MIVSAKYRIIMGTIPLMTAVTMAALGGFEWYNPDSANVLALIGLGSTLIGLGLVKEIKSNKKE